MPDLKTFRTDKKMTQGELAERLGVKQSFISKIENGRVGITDSIIDYIKKEYGVIIEDSFVKEEPPSYGKPIPYYNVEIMATPIESINDQNRTPEYEVLVPGFEDCDFVCTVYGDSMYPKIKNGARIICRKLRGDYIQYGEIYFVVMQDFRIVKRIQKGHEEDTVILCSENHYAKDEHGNQIYQDLEVKKEDIIHLYIVKGWLNQNAV